MPGDPANHRYPSNGRFHQALSGQNSCGHPRKRASRGLSISHFANPLFGDSSLSQNAGRAREGLGPLEFQSWPAACTAVTGADFAAGILRISARSGEGVRGGELASPSTSLPKSLFRQAEIPFSGIRSAFYSVQYKIDILLFPAKPHLRCGFMPFAITFSSWFPAELGIYNAYSTNNNRQAPHNGKPVCCCINGRNRISRGPRWSFRCPHRRSADDSRRSQP